jgi:hypothetical protein
VGSVENALKPMGTLFFKVANCSEASIRYLNAPVPVRSIGSGSPSDNVKGLGG